MSVTTHPTLIMELLGFAPNMLLDDMINVAQNKANDAVLGIEMYTEAWLDERAKRLKTSKEDEQEGDSHVDGMTSRVLGCLCRHVCPG